FLILNGIKDKQIPKGYPQEQGKVAASSLYIDRQRPALDIIILTLVLSHDISGILLALYTLLTGENVIRTTPLHWYVFQKSRYLLQTRI
ncbi:MAG: hypothetical protein WAM14_05890, partial [Candidatus Nitrosopolaris sp.]